MPYSDMLRMRRTLPMGLGMDPGADTGHNASQADDRCIYLTDEEQSHILEQAQPGEEITLLVRGRVGDDGKFDVTGIHGMQGKEAPSDQGMPPKPKPNDQVTE